MDRKLGTSFGGKKTTTKKPRKNIFTHKSHRPSCQCKRIMNSTMFQYTTEDRYAEAFAKNFTTVLVGLIVNCVNGIIVFTFFKSSIFYNDPRYILYIHMVINDMLMVFFSVSLVVMAYAWPKVPVPFCITLLIIASTTHKNTPLTLAGMAVERYIAICKPLHHHQICTVRRTYILISLIWGVGVLPGLADLILLSIVRPLSVFTTSSLCSTTNVYSTPYHEDQSKITHGLYTSVVWVILVFTYCRVLIAARRASADKSSAKKAQNTILLHGVQLLLCMLSIITPIIDKIYSQLVPTLRSKITFFNYLLTNLLPRLLSPLIYGVRDKQFFKYMKGLFSCRLLNVKVESTKQ
ncbi:odorant receptor 131-2-like [Rhinichthys klamathensis goyatoka]|uniref:odorant receptor 131-2-like n=1 Tax=Rhinichthys klamathensis goyatoka TaxID=3034132 RepID=UPI0024B623FA|nr:odorant receptor 131-2-like [Rhinichthys klamathensis goyatoka]